MERTLDERFEVRVSRWKYGVATLICFILTILAAVTFVPSIPTMFSYSAKTAHAAVVLTFLLFMLVIISAFMSTKWLRRRPLFVIDYQGITDFQGGFNLIKWQNIEHASPRILNRGEWALLVKVNNYNDLVSQGNPLMRPFLLLQGRLNSFSGGQILLPMTWSDTDSMTVREQISNYSKNKC